MNILVVDDKQMVLNSMVEEVKLVFPNANIYAKRSAERAIDDVLELKGKNEILDYAFLDIQLELFFA